MKSVPFEMENAYFKAYIFRHLSVFSIISNIDNLIHIFIDSIDSPLLWLLCRWLCVYDKCLLYWPHFYD